MRAPLLVLAILSAAPAIACAGPAPDPTFQASLERGACMGSCPSYRVTVQAGGAVTFVGQTNGMGRTSCPGEHQWKVDPAAVARLRDLIDRSNVFKLKDEYRGSITDAPSFSIDVTRNGRSKHVTDYVGSMVGMPRSITDIEAAIDATAGVSRCVAH